MKKRLVLIGDNTSKRYEYFAKACESYNLNFEYIPYDNITLNEGDLVKIDPVKITSNSIEKLDSIIEDYTSKLDKIASYNVRFYNTPQDILLLLDKYKTKLILEQADINTTPMLDRNFASSSELFSYLKAENITRIFIKPRFGSGASGIVALRYNKRLNQAIIHTTIFEKNGKFYNGNKTFYHNSQEKVERIINFILSTQVVVEKWVSKKTHNNLNYDLRVVMFKQELLYVIARGSSSPITNLHLNNMPLDVTFDTEKITLFCRKVMKQFPDLCYAGIDILITPKDELYVIEINAQGDAIYNDFYTDNTIYTRQIQHFLEEAKT